MAANGPQPPPTSIPPWPPKPPARTQQVEALVASSIPPWPPKPQARPQQVEALVASGIPPWPPKPPPERRNRKRNNLDKSLSTPKTFSPFWKKTQEIEDIDRKQGKYKNVPEMGHIQPTAPTGIALPFRKQVAALPSAAELERTQTLRTQLLSDDKNLMSASEVGAASLETRVNTTIALWITLINLFLFHTQRSKDDEEYIDLDKTITFMPLDPLLLKMAVSGSTSVYAHLSKIEVVDFMECSVTKRRIDINGEKVALQDGKERIDKRYTISANINCPNLDVDMPYSLKTDKTAPENKDQVTWSKLKLNIKNFETDIIFAVTKINAEYDPNTDQFKPPHLTLSYKMADIQITEHNQPKSIISKEEISELFRNYINQVKDDPTAFSEKVKQLYLDRVTHSIVKLKWIHQLPQFMVTPFSDEKSVPEYTKFQTRLLEAIFFIMLDPKVYQLLKYTAETTRPDKFNRLVFYRTVPESRSVETLNELCHPDSVVQNEDWPEIFKNAISYENDTSNTKNEKLLRGALAISNFLCEALCH